MEEAGQSNRGMKNVFYSEVEKNLKEAFLYFNS